MTMTMDGLGGADFAYATSQDSSKQLQRLETQVDATATGSNVVVRKDYGHDDATIDTFVVDILSIGSETRQQHLLAQQGTMGSHLSVRHFFNVTEVDDVEPRCHQEVSPEEVMEVSAHCKTVNTNKNYLKLFLRRSFANQKWLQKKVNPVGWMCAQKRPATGLYKTLKRYRDTLETLPDFLIVIDDDTFINMEGFARHMKPQRDRQIVVAGCKCREPLHIINFTFPFGGYGLFYSKSSLEYLMQPIHCPNDVSVCARLEENLVDENDIFENGMSLIDLMMMYLERHKFSERKSWGDSGYCFHSDWYLAYFTNFYNVSEHGDILPDVEVERLHEYRNSSQYGSRKVTGNCQCEGSKNGTLSKFNVDVCHYMSPQLMEHEASWIHRKYPTRFATSQFGVGGVNTTKQIALELNY